MVRRPINQEQHRPIIQDGHMGNLVEGPGKGHDLKGAPQEKLPEAGSGEWVRIDHKCRKRARHRQLTPRPITMRRRAFTDPR
jgi:hypothetical protein